MSSKKSIPSFLSTKAFLFLVILVWLNPPVLHAQDQRNDFSLSVGASFGYTPKVTLGKREDAGIVLSVFGDLQYHNIIGRLQYSSALVQSFDSNNLKKGSSAFNGSLGYNIALTDQVRMPLMLIGGASWVQYSNGINGSTGDTFTDVSPQVGFMAAPYYQLTDHLSIQGAARYLKGFAVGDRGRAIDLMDVSIGIRFTL